MFRLPWRECLGEDAGQRRVPMRQVFILCILWRIIAFSMSWSFIHDPT
ncbi:MAG: hypothetical protein K9G33_08040 [Sneathiella sp.]|nr:hypothetical protein [Sneathiella sp.]